MFSAPTTLPKEGTFNVLPMIWNYLVKAESLRKKARCVANGSTSQSGTIVMANTYAACIEQPCARIFWGIAAMKNLIVVGADCSNAFAEADAPTEPLYMKIDQQFRNWWNIHRKFQPLPDSAIYVKVQHAIQGHPESPRLWQTFIDDILLNKLGFHTTTHEKCIYRKVMDGKEIFILRQVDDIAVAAPSTEMANAVITAIGKYMKSPIKMEGIIDLFNGLNIDQTRDYIKVTPRSYITRVVKRHNHWMETFPESNEPLPICTDSKDLQALDNDESTTEDQILALEKEFGFKYRAATGELIFAMVTARPDLSFAVMKMCQFNNQPGRLHFQAVRQMMLFMRDTQDEGMYFWRTKPHKSLPIAPHPVLRKDTYILEKRKEHDTAFQLYVMCDSDWATDTSHRKSVSGICILWAGAAVIYKSNYQKANALSSTEAEFYALCDAGKLILYVRSILEELGLEQEYATPVYEDNQGCLLMVNSGQPSKRTRHLDNRQFAILDWVETDLLEVIRVSTKDNTPDGLTKSNAKILFHRHNQILMGKHRPKYHNGY